MRKAIVGFIVRSFETLAPFTVVNSEFGKMHYCLTWRGAMAWLACYDASEFGNTSVLNFNGEVVATKGV